MTHFEKLNLLRQLMHQENLDAFIIPKVDEHQGEYVGPHSERLLWLTGFDGSAGFSIVLQDRASLFVDGRYTLQAAQQVDPSLFEIVPVAQVSGPTWLSNHLVPGSKIGYDPWLITEQELQKYKKSLSEKNISFCPVSKNLIDQIWNDRPEKICAPIYIHPFKFSGQIFPEKLKIISLALQKMCAHAAIITMTDSIGWLFNIRGDDYTFLPTTSAYAIVYETGKADIFIDKQKVSKEIKEYFETYVSIKNFNSFEHVLLSLGVNKKPLLIDPTTAPIKIINLVENIGGIVLRGADPIIALKACKNIAELDGMRNTHIRDGAALTTFLHWMAQEGPKGQIDELQAAEKLLEYRQKFPEFKKLSFATISSTGPNGAVIHYRATPKTNRKISRHDLYLTDSGGHYSDGSTDVTRTIVLGDPTAEQRERFTRVLKGHIALATSIFPEGTSGSQLDILARSPLWQIGLDYAHGTGHGVGALLSIHEGPQSIGSTQNTIALKAGMILSNEPGYYKPGAYGIRIENLVIVKSLDLPDAEKKMLGFETITLAPIDRNLIDLTLLTEPELKWLNAYHQEVYEKLSPFLQPEASEWLKQVTRSLVK